MKISLIFYRCYTYISDTVLNNEKKTLMVSLIFDCIVEYFLHNREIN